MSLTGNVAAIIDRFMQSPEARAIAKKQAAEDLETRKRKVAEVAALMDAALVAVKEYDAKLAKSEPKVLAAKAAFERAQNEYAELQAERRRVVGDLEHQADRLRWSLSGTANERIDGYRAELFEWSQSLQYEQLLGWDGSLLWSNKASIERRFAAIREAIAEVEPWRVAALSDEQIVAKYTRLVADLPALEPRPQTVGA